MKLKEKVQSSSKNLKPSIPKTAKAPMQQKKKLQFNFDDQKLIYDALNPTKKTSQAKADEHLKQINFSLLYKKYHASGNINVMDKSGNTLLNYAVMGGNKEGVETLIKCGADINLGNKLKQTPLHLAAMDNKPEVAQLLISRGAKIDAKTKGGYTPLDLADSGSKTAKILLNEEFKEAEEIAKNFNQAINAKLDIVSKKLPSNEELEAELNEIAKTVDSSSPSPKQPDAVPPAPEAVPKTRAPSSLVSPAPEAVRKKQPPSLSIPSAPSAVTKSRSIPAPSATELGPDSDPKPLTDSKNIPSPPKAVKPDVKLSKASKETVIKPAPVSQKPQVAQQNQRSPDGLSPNELITLELMPESQNVQVLPNREGNGQVISFATDLEAQNFAKKMYGDNLDVSKTFSKDADTKRFAITISDDEVRSMQASAKVNKPWVSGPHMPQSQDQKAVQVNKTSIVQQNPHEIKPLQQQQYALLVTETPGVFAQVSVTTPTQYRQNLNDQMDKFLASEKQRFFDIQKQKNPDLRDFNDINKADLAQFEVYEKGQIARKENLLQQNFLQEEVAANPARKEFLQNKLGELKKIQDERDNEYYASVERAKKGEVTYNFEAVGKMNDLQYKQNPLIFEGHIDTIQGLTKHTSLDQKMVNELKAMAGNSSEVSAREGAVNAQVIFNNSHDAQEFLNKIAAVHDVKGRNQEGKSFYANADNPNKFIVYVTPGEVQKVHKSMQDGNSYAESKGRGVVNEAIKEVAEETKQPIANTAKGSVDKAPSMVRSSTATNTFSSKAQSSQSSLVKAAQIEATVIESNNLVPSSTPGNKQGIAKGKSAGGIGGL